MATITIKPNHQARKRIMDLPNYMENKGDAWRAIDDILNDYGMQLDWEQRHDCAGDEGRRVFNLKSVEGDQVYCDGCNEKVEATDFNNRVVITWYRMPSGRYEIVAYLS